MSLKLSQVRHSFIFLGLIFSQILLAEVPLPAPPTLAASGYLLMDFDSGKVLAAQDTEARLEPASLTKIMTAYAVFKELKEGNIQLDEEVLVSEKAWRTPGSRMFIEVGKKVKVVDLIKGLIIQSGNDSCVALAEHIAGSEEIFAEVMNNHAQRLGMEHTHFVNSTGLPDSDHYTTPADIAKVAAATIRDFPEYYPWYGEKEFYFNKIKQHNRNKLLWRDESVDGIKTGHTEGAGYCLVASAIRDGMRLISVVMGTESEKARAKASQSLLNYGFRFYETHRLYSGGDVLNRARIWKGEKEKLSLGLVDDLSVTIPRRQYKNLDARMEIDPKIMAPIEQGAVLGRVSISLAGEEIAQASLVALDSVTDGSLWQQIKDSALLWLEWKLEEKSETLLEFPCDFSLKAMGRDEPGFDMLVMELVRRHAPDIHEGAVRTRSSKGGKWVSVTVTLRADSKAQLDAIYLDLTAHEKIVMAL